MPGKLALYSDQLPPGTDPVDEMLLQWLPAGGTIGYVPSSPDRERAWFRSREKYYARYRLAVRFFGLEDEFHDSRRAKLLSCDAIHLSGGNTFRFLYWLRNRGMVGDLQRYIARGGVLIGVSAGAILTTPDIQTSLLCGDTLYPDLSDYSGLSLVNFALVPHFDGSPEARLALANYSMGFDGLVYAVPDGAGIIVDGTRLELVGRIFNARGGELTESV